MNFSRFQNDIFNFVANSNNGSAVINAVAGSGKTTTIVECAKRVSRAHPSMSILFLAFNKSISSELEERMRGTKVVCKTLHAHGFRSIFKTFSGLKKKDNKWFWFVKDNFDNLCSINVDNNIDRANMITAISNLLDKCRINLIQSGDMDAIENLADHHGIKINVEGERIVNDLLTKVYDAATIEKMGYDFTDMITIPCMVEEVKENLPKYDLIFIDECQDLSKAQQELMLASLNKGGRFIAVGDPKQAINGFAGADANSFYHLVDLAKGNELPLSVCYRCGKDIVNLAKGIVPNIEAFEGAVSGEIKRTHDLRDIKYGDMVLCRSNAPLVSLCLKMLANGISAKVKGKDIAEGMKKMIANSKATNVADLFDYLDSEIVKAKDAILKKGKKVENSTYISTLEDKVECIKVIADGHFRCSEVIETLDRVFSDYKSARQINLSSVHKSKGLEADRVFILLPNKLPLVWREQQEWQYEQEKNLEYVAYTRAKKTLTFIDLSEDGLRSYQF